jgi:ABC-type cobalamin/Fe3+-siderophores transport system ATPase subunit
VSTTQISPDSLSNVAPPPIYHLLLSVVASTLVGSVTVINEHTINTASKTEMHEMLSRFINELSGGERQRAYLSAVLAAETDILVLDEPTAYADMHYARKFCLLLRDIAARENKTVIAVMHDINLATALADNIAVLDKGKITARLPTEKMLETDIIEKTFEVKKYNAESTVFFA